MQAGHSAATVHTMHHHQHDARSDDAGEAAAIGTALPGAGVDQDHAHDRHGGHSAAMFRRKFWISLGLTIRILIWRHMRAQLIGYAPPALPGAMWIAPIFGTAVFRIWRLAVRNRRDRRASRSIARNDDADRARDRCCVRLQRRGDVRLSGHAVVGGVRDIRDRHASRPFVCAA